MMSLIYLLDTNTISEPLKDFQNQKVVEKIALFNDKIAISSFVVYEMMKGLYLLPESKKRLKILEYTESVLSKFPVFSYTEDAALWHGKEAARLQSIGKSPPIIDSQMAAVAKVNNMIVVTRNIDDFKNFADVKLENWFD
jgi:tRNA(fMet)-specific endonuclease VapC